MRNILTISTKINRGGAGKIAYNIHSTLSNGNFLYAYDKNGLSLSRNGANLIKGSNLLTPFLNYISFSVFGRDLFGMNTHQLERLVQNSEIIHLHVLHSYGFNYKQLFALIIKYNKLVVVTAHDSWYYSGRCAIRHECYEWQNMCIKCEHLNYYPVSILDNAHNEFVMKTELINKVSNLIFVSPSKWLLNDIKHVYPSKTVLHIPNGIDTSLFKDRKYTIHDTIIHLVFIVNDFKDKDKVDVEFMNNLLTLNNIHLHLIGQNCSFVSKNSTCYGYITKEEIIDVLSMSDIFLFFSKIDNYPTVILEALCAGIHVASTKSKGAEEILSEFEYTEINNTKDFIDRLNSHTFIERIKMEKLKKLQRNKAIKIFSDKLMLSSYSEIYEAILKNEI